MNHYIVGQRWISNTESELGLGIITEINRHHVSVLYLACHEKRTYAINNAPLTRAKFSIGAKLKTDDQRSFIVSHLEEQQGLIIYISTIHQSFPEIELDHHLQFNQAQDRLFTGQTDPSSWFQLRYQTWQYQQQHQQSPVKGLIGGRTNLLPHQLYIAHEATHRLNPRVLLADEVGLGKTIEAGLILHYRLINKLSQRVLIIVPESLQHQWLVTAF